MTKDDLMLLPPPNHHGGTYESSPFNYYTADQMREYAKKAMLAEREACAQIVENEAWQYASPVWAVGIVNEIRARSRS